MKVAPPFVGRDDELGALHRWLDEVVRGEPRVIAVSGEAGIGKSQLLTRFLGELSVDRPDVTVLRGTSHEGRGVPYLPLASALQPIGDLTALLAPLRRDDTPDHADARRLQLHLGASALLRGATTAHPVVLLLDDLHWADQGTLELVAHLVHDVSGATGTAAGRVLLVLAHRPIITETPVAELLARVRREPWHRELVVSGFDMFTLHALVEALTGYQPSRRLLNGLEDASTGNPLLVRSLIARLEAGGALSVRGQQLQYRGGEELLAGPRELDELLRDRVAALPARCRELLTVAAFLGEGEPLRDLRAITGIDDDRFATLVGQARDAGILEDDDTIAFDHPQVRQVLYQGPRGPRRRELHLRIADYLEPREQTPDRVIALAHHLRRAGAAAEPERVVRACVRAANEAAGVVAWAEAARSYDAAIAAIAAQADRQSAFLALLHSRAAYAHWYNHDNQAARSHATTAIALARELRDVALWARALDTLGRATWSSQDATFGTSFDLRPYEDFLDAVGETEPGLRARVHFVKATLQIQATEVDGARTDLDRATTLSAGTDDNSLRASVAVTAGGLALAAADANQATGLFVEAGRLARAADEPLLALWAARGEAMSRWAAGELTDAMTAAQNAMDAGPPIGAWAECAVVNAVATGIASARGDLARAETFAAATARLAAWAGNPPAALIVHPALAAAKAATGDFEAADAVLAEWEASDPRAASRFRELVAVLAGDHRITPFRARPLPAAPGLFALPALAVAVEIGDIVGDHDRLRWAAAGIEHLAGRGLRFELGWCFLVPRLAAVTAAHLGQQDRARHWFDEAAVVAARAGAAPEVERVARDRARLLP